MGVSITKQIKDQSPIHKNVFRPKLYFWLVTGIGLAGYLTIPFFLFFGAVIVFVEGLRVFYLNWAVASFISAILIFSLSKILINRFGASFFMFSDNAISIKIPLGKSKLITKDDIIHIQVEYPSAVTTVLNLFSPECTIATYDQIIKFRINRWRSETQLLAQIEELTSIYNDDFAIIYHKSRSSFTSIFIRMSQDGLGMIGLTIITFYFFLALWGAFAMLISPPNVFYYTTLFLRNPLYGNGDLPGYTWKEAINHAPSKDFWFGTDFFGRDIFARMVYGTSFTFMVAIVGSIISISIILVLGLSSALYGGWWDSLVSRIADSLLTFPPFIPLILISTIALPVRLAIPGGYFLAVFAAMGFFTWPAGTRLLRTEILDLLNMEYILAARLIGANPKTIMFKHILPKIFPTILIISTYIFTDIILGMTLLGFIGMDSESTLTWGSDLSKAIKFGNNYLNTWWTIVFPTIWIFLLIFGLTLLSDSIRDVLDPRLRGGESAVPLEMLAYAEVN